MRAYIKIREGVCGGSEAKRVAVGALLEKVSTIEEGNILCR
jgi:hypothetical protein